MLDVVMTTANLPLVQWRQQNVTLSLKRQLNFRSDAVSKKACYLYQQCVGSGPLLFSFLQFVSR